MYNLINNILSLPTTNANSSVTQCAIALLVLGVIISLHGIFSFFSKVFSIR